MKRNSKWTKPQTLPEFKPSSHYIPGTDIDLLNDDNHTISPTPGGMELIAQYYARKYGTNIVLPADESEGEKIYASLITFAANINTYLEPIKKANQDCRAAFFIGAESTHATPIIYIRENGKEGFLYADTKGVNEWAVELMQDETKVEVYAIEDWRQADSYSCYIEALTFSRDATAMSKDKQNFRIPGLLNFLDNHSEPSAKGTFRKLTSLPPELLKTAQSSEFTKNYRDESKRVVHDHKGKPETIEEFRERYTDKDISIRRKPPKKVETTDISRYLRKKGIQSADIIEMQFYLNHIEKKLGYKLSDETRHRFVQEAKDVFRSQDPAYKTREGIKKFAENFLLNYKKTHKKNSNSSTPLEEKFSEHSKKHGLFKTPVEQKDNVGEELTKVSDNSLGN